MDSCYRTIFKRYELKYMLDRMQYAEVRSAMENHMKPDEYGESTVCSLYFDTPNKQIIRSSLERPIYKEKLRLRSYGIAGNDTDVFAELKKKYEGVVYKRRETMKYRDAASYLFDRNRPINPTQITNEIDYFISFYKGLEPSMLLIYDRTAFFGKDDDGFRITFDKNIRWRDTELCLSSGLYGNSLTGENEVLMEVKAGDSIPLWLAETLSENRIFKTSFSKYGSAYIESLKKENEFITKERLNYCA
ncbi:MAG: polyphosphate polymerase domain-containing protein [Clostridiales bacterium]|nr:polyphosphate polymerase domain-containing protein [Clostridiales bacterium]